MFYFTIADLPTKLPAFTDYTFLYGAPLRRCQEAVEGAGDCRRFFRANAHGRPPTDLFASLGTGGASSHASGTRVAPLDGYRFGEYADRFWRDILGVRDLSTIDNSDYEGASIVHDLNRPVPPELWEGFDAVVEAGSLEHIFNFPVAIANLMKMVRVGGTIFLTTVANNLCGHGFYQFSPELIYRVFSPENGFDNTSVVFLEAGSPSVELVPITRSYEVADPKIVGCQSDYSRKLRS